MATGVCDLNGDAPVEPAFEFPTCCEDDGVSRGTCVPEDSVPADRRDSLDEEECPEDEGFLCVPNTHLADPDYHGAPCTTEPSFIGEPGPGACVLKCVTGFRGLFLSRSTCADYELCAPCMDPFTGAPTGACE
jgi:hypothetical protein